MTQVTPFPFDSAQAQSLKAWLKQGLPLVFPTETFYALGGLALSATAAENVYRLKERERGKPLLVLAKPEMLHDLVVMEGRSIQRLMQEFWPGPLTIVFQPKPQAPDFLRGPGGGIAVRHSPHPAVNALLDLVGEPLTGSSANLSGQPACRTITAARQQLAAETLCFLDGGSTVGGRPSTLIDTTQSPFKVLREGAIESSQLTAWTGELTLAQMEQRGKLS